MGGPGGLMDASGGLVGCWWEGSGGLEGSGVVGDLGGVVGGPGGLIGGPTLRSSVNKANAFKRQQ